MLNITTNSHKKTVGHYFDKWISRLFIVLTTNKILSGASVKENYRKTTEVVRPCEENERGAHSEKNARCRHTREKKKRTTKPKMG